MITNMNIRRLERLCCAGQWGFAAGTLFVLILAVLSLGPAPEPAIAAVGPVEGPANTGSADVTLSDLSTIWKRDLRQRLIEPKAAPKPKPKPPPPPPPPVNLPKLLATFVERGQSWGLFVNKSGQQRVRAAGGQIDDFAIESVTPGGARLSRKGKSFAVTAPTHSRTNKPRRSGRRRP